ncbi:MAG: M23 family metallopeptidase [Proteobacteria bacterium]|nr:M23 family metallopeptidase [Pseudomonadota bacterium]MBU1716094.1 M23 family metallopeptidase [Pseudomonadota bacterium]
MEPLEGIEKNKGKTPFIVLLIPFAILLVAGAMLLKLYERERPQLSILNDLSKVGMQEEVQMVLTDAKSGLRRVEVYMLQGNKRVKVHENEFAGMGFMGNSGPERVEESFVLDGRSLKFEDGEATLEVDVRDYSWWGFMQGNLAVLTYPVLLDTNPPRVAIIDYPRYIIPGGAGIVTYRLDEPVAEHGVRVNGYYHPGFPLPQHGEDVYGAMLAVVYDTETLDVVQVEAKDQAGNLGVKPFAMILRRAKINTDRINVSDNFLNLKMPEFAQHYPDLVTGDLLAQYLVVNNTIRQENNKKIREACSKSNPERLWSGRFKRMERSSRRAGFAEYRTYYYNGKEVDKQVHLGIDLASTQHASVQAANRGQVVFADYLGIYGNVIIIDHGQGVFTLYSHLSRIDVAVGDMVEQDAGIGLSGASGMAGGDHLHFSVLINGIFVNPLEWWDAQWLKINIVNFL